MPGETVARATIVLYDGAEKPVADEVDVLLDITNAPYGITTSTWVKGPAIPLTLQYFDGPGDNYRITAWVKGNRTTGAFVTANPKIHIILKLMLIPAPTVLTFRPWLDLTTSYPKVAQFLRLGLADDAAAQNRYEDLQKNKPAALACFMNLITAMDGIGIGSSKTPLDYIKEIRWDKTFAQDRFFCYIDPAMVKPVVDSAADGEFAEEKDPGALHPGATLSYKQIRYPYSNVQLTFHQNPSDGKMVGALECIMFEPDMDLYKNLLDHSLLEVLPNLLTHGLTDPVDILSLRWLDTTDAFEDPFDPGYTLTRKL
jgi:hypothetical protein